MGRGSMASADQARLHPDILAVDPGEETARIAKRMAAIVGTELRRRGVVIAISGGVDSAVCAALAVCALGSAKVHGLMLPERDSSPHSLMRAMRVAEQRGIAYDVED